MWFLWQHSKASIRPIHSVEAEFTLWKSATLNESSVEPMFNFTEPKLESGLLSLRALCCQSVRIFMNTIKVILLLLIAAVAYSQHEISKQQTQVEAVHWISSTAVLPGLHATHLWKDCRGKDQTIPLQLLCLPGSRDRGVANRLLLMIVQVHTDVSFGSKIVPSAVEKQATRKR